MSSVASKLAPSQVSSNADRPDELTRRIATSKVMLFGDQYAVARSVHKKDAVFFFPYNQLEGTIKVNKDLATLVPDLNAFLNMMVRFKIELSPIEETEKHFVYFFKHTQMAKGAKRANDTHDEPVESKRAKHAKKDKEWKFEEYDGSYLIAEFNTGELLVLLLKDPETGEPLITKAEFTLLEEHLQKRMVNHKRETFYDLFEQKTDREDGSRFEDGIYNKEVYPTLEAERDARNNIAEKFVPQAVWDSYVYGSWDPAHYHFNPNANRNLSLGKYVQRFRLGDSGLISVNVTSLFSDCYEEHTPFIVMKVKDDKILYNNRSVQYEHDRQYVPNKKVTDGVKFRECEAFRGEEHVFRCAYKDEFVRFGTFLNKDSKPVEPTEIIKNARDFFWFLVLNEGQRETFKKYKWMESGKVVMEYLPNEPLKKVFL